MEAFIKGMDISSLPEQWDGGRVFYDENGMEIDALDLVKANGVNYIRLRIWNNPENVPESGGYCNLEKTVAFAKKIKQAGFGFFLDFHYSDWWADPGKQVKPKAWESLSFNELVQAVYDFTLEVMVQLKEEGAFPDMVQIGNEIRSGMIFPDGAVQNWPGLSALINSGIQAVRDVDKKKQCQIVIHLDQGGRFTYFKEWFDAALAHGVTDFDMIGLSYYPFWHGTFNEFKDTMDKLVDRYNKPLIVAEIAHPWRLTGDGFVGSQQARIIGFPATPDAQYNVLNLIMNITANIRDGFGRGVFYWEPLMVPVAGQGGWAENMGVLDEGGKPLKGLKSFKYECGDFDSEEVVKIYAPKELTVLKGQTINLPSQVKALYWDGRCIQQPVVWKLKASVLEVGSYVVNGIVTGTNIETFITINVTNQHEKAYNYLGNGNFEQGLDGWQVMRSDESIRVDLIPEFILPFPEPPEISAKYEAPMNFNMEISTEVEILEEGTYRLGVEQRGYHTTGVEVELYAQQDGKRHQLQIHPSDEDWTCYEIKEIELRKGFVRIGVDIQSPPIHGRFKNFKLLKEESR